MTLLRIILTAILLISSGCNQILFKNKKKYSEVKLIMGSYARVDICADVSQVEQVKAVYKDVWGRLDSISKKMDRFNEESEVSKINNSKGSSIAVSDDIYYLIRESKYYNQISGGVFDITVTPLINLWSESEKNQTIPTREHLAKIKESIGLDKIKVLDNYKIKFVSPGMAIDFGAITPGFAADEVANIIKANNLLDFYVDIGGEIYAGGRNCQNKNKKWRIGIRDPKNKEGIIGIIELSDMAVSTSGDYEKYYLIKGEKYSHIINPITGMPQTGNVSATIIAPNALAADSLATALMILNVEEGINLIQSLESNRYASMIIIEKENNILEMLESKEFKKYKLNR